MQRTYRPARAYFKEIVKQICEPFSGEIRLISMETVDSVSSAYRTAFGEYANKLGALQRLLDSGGPDNGRLEAAMQEVETARQAHNSARDVLARELGVEFPVPRTSHRAESFSVFGRPPRVINQEHFNHCFARLQLQAEALTVGESGRPCEKRTFVGRSAAVLWTVRK